MFESFGPFWDFLCVHGNILFNQSLSLSWVKVRLLSYGLKTIENSQDSYLCFQDCVKSYNDFSDRHKQELKT